jgi:hypothetical protein
VVKEGPGEPGTADGSASGPPAPVLVVAVGGPSGAGKTTLVRAVAARLPGAVALFFDDYAGSSVYPADLSAWVQAGADPDSWRTPRLADDLRALRAGEAIVPPGPGTGAGQAPPLGPARYVVLEEPFGRARRELRGALDVVAVLELPLAAALARRVQRQLGWAREAAAGEARERPLRALDAYLAWYLDSRGWEAYAAAQRTALAGADLVLDGTRPTDELAAQVVGAVGARAGAVRPCGPSAV